MLSVPKKKMIFKTEQKNQHTNVNVKATSTHHIYKKPTKRSQKNTITREKSEKKRKIVEYFADGQFMFVVILI